jgi:hypothetical protein
MSPTMRKRYLCIDDADVLAADCLMLFADCFNCELCWTLHQASSERQSAVSTSIGKSECR